MTFAKWFKACEDIAMESEWCIDEVWPRWRELFDAGATPAQAIDKLFEEVSARHDSMEM